MLQLKSYKETSKWKYLKTSMIQLKILPFSESVTRPREVFNLWKKRWIWQMELILRMMIQATMKEIKPKWNLKSQLIMKILSSIILYKSQFVLNIQWLCNFQEEVHNHRIMENRKLLMIYQKTKRLRKKRRKRKKKNEN